MPPISLPQRIRDFLAHRPNRPLLLLVVSMGLVGAALVDAQRAVARNRVVAEGVLRDYSAFAAWSYAQAASAALDSLAWGVMGPIMHEFPHQGDAPHPEVLVHQRPYDPRTAAHRGWPYPPSVIFGYALKSDTLGAAQNAVPDERYGWQVRIRTTFAPHERALLRDTVLAHLRGSFRPGSRYAVFAAGQGSSRRMIAYALMPMEGGDTTLYGFVLEHDVYLRLFRTLFERHPVLPEAATGGLPNAGFLALAVADRQGAALFVSDTAPDWRFAADAALSPLMGGMTVRAAVRPQMAGHLVIGGLPASRLPILLVVLGLAAVLTVVAIGQLRREGELARLRGDFVAAVSHELRSPLAQVRLFVETLTLGRAATDERRRWALEQIDRETTRLAHLVENVLLFSRASRGVDLGPLATADVSAEAAAAVRAFAPLAGARRMTLSADLPDAVPAPLHAESFRQVLVNLLDNAVKYGPPGQTVTVAVRREGGGVHVSVADQGPGVPEKEREAVWKPFFRGRAPAVRAVGGSGIGLSVVRDVVGRHGGRAWVEDAPGGGARFVVLLPGGDGGSEASPEASSVATEETAADTSDVAVPAKA